MIDTATTSLGRFGHHPDPATDFEVEVEELIGMAYNRRVGFDPEPTLDERVSSAMTFRVGGVESAVAAKAELRKIDAELHRSPSPAGVTEAAVEAARPNFEQLTANALAAVEALDDWTNNNETEFTGWGEGEVPPGATFWRVKTGQALKALKELPKPAAVAALLISPWVKWGTKPPFEFDRYVDGVLMAEGVKINRHPDLPPDLPSAMRKAAQIASRGPNSKVPVLVLRIPPANGEGR